MGSDKVSTKSTQEAEEKTKLVEKLLEKYDANKDGVLSDEEIALLAKDYEVHGKLDKETREQLKKFDSNQDGHLDTEELVKLRNELDINESTVRYAAYAAAMARASRYIPFRYLAFTSDVGEALRPVASLRLVNLSYAVSFGYCIADVGWEGYKLHRRGYITEKKEPMSLTQCLVERSTFQAIASIIVPAVTIHTTVDIFKHVFKRVGRFQRFGPSIAGLCVIPALPLYLDHPVESGIEYVFERFGPWAKHGHSPKSHQD